jgi:hypothetical protein
LGRQPLRSFMNNCETDISVRGWAIFVRSLSRKPFGACGTDFL